MRIELFFGIAFLLLVFVGMKWREFRKEVDHDLTK
jgi:hypothetical protein